MKHFSIHVTSIFLCIFLSSHLVLADVFNATSNNISIEVVDYRDLLGDILFWIGHKAETPVATQTLVNNSIYPISVTIYNNGAAPIKIVKNAVGGLSTAQENQIAQIYQYDAFASVAQISILGAAIALISVELLNFITGRNIEAQLETICEGWYTQCKYALSGVTALCAGAMHVPAVMATNALINQAFNSQALSQTSLIAPGKSMSFIVFASQSPAGQTLKVPIFDQQDNQVASFSCPFGVVAAS